MSNYNVEISADNTITVGLPSTGNGVAGPRGEKGYSAYEVAVKNGYSGTEAEWLATLKGEKGDKGEPGANGTDGKPGKDGVDGASGTDGKPGANGLSAYELAAKNGFTGNESAWLASLKGEKGDKGPKGDDGQNGVNGVDGKDGLSAYSIAVKNGYNGTEGEWVNKWLRGTIVSADVDDAGVMSMTDINGNVINTNLAPIAKAASSASAAEASAQAAATSANEAATHETNAATSLAETRKSEQNAKSSEQNAAASAEQAAQNAKTLQADWNQTDDTRTDFIKNKPQNLKNIGDTDAINLYSFFKDDNAGNPVYMLMQELTSYSPDSNTFPAPASCGFNGIVYGKLRTGNGYNQLVALVTANLGYEYDFLYSSSNNYRPVVVKDETSNKYYWAMRVAGSYQNVIMLGQFTKAPLFTKIMATDGQGTLPSGWSLIHDAKTYELPRTIVAKAVSDRNGARIDTTYLKKEDAQQSIATNTLTATDATFTGQTIVPTANEGNSSNAIASTEFVAKSIAALVNSAPETLNTLNELATALGNDPNFATTVTNALAKKMNSAEASDTYATKTEAGVPYQIKRNTAYKVGDVLTSPSLPPGCVIVVTQAGTTGSTEPDWATIKSNMGGVIADNTVTFYINDTLSKHSVGDIVYKPLTKTTEHEYLLPLDGQTIDGTTYKRLVDYLGTTTLPNLNGRYLRADTTPGQMVEAGLPNITGDTTSVAFTTNSSSGVFTSGCFSMTRGGLGEANGENYKISNWDDSSSGLRRRNANFNASRSSAVYGKSDTVTPLTYTVRVYICYA